MNYGADKVKENIAVLLAMTFVFLTALLSFAALLRVRSEAVAEEAVSTKALSINDENYNEDELYILDMLGKIPELINSSGSRIVNWSLEHKMRLAEYFEKEEIKLDEEKLAKLDEYIQGCKEILMLEQERDLGKISVDGRNMMIYLYKNIYKLFGLNISYDITQNIEEIYSENGTVIYRNTDEKVRQPVHMEVLIITLIILIIFICLCFYIARKNQIIVKDGEYNGYDEKKYA